jgi:ADP-ribose pyrophosphatase
MDRPPAGDGALFAFPGGEFRGRIPRMAPDTPSEKRTLAEGRHLRFVLRAGWEFVERRNISGIVVIIGTTNHGCLVLVTQWREPVQAWVVELPAGLAGDIPGSETEELAEAAKRELMEETGFAAASMEAVLTGPPSPGISDEVVTFYRARGLVRLARGGGGPGERVRAHAVPLPELFDWLDRMRSKGVLVDPKVLAGAYLVRKERDEWTHE